MTKMSVSFPVCNGKDLEAGLQCVTDQVLSCSESMITDCGNAYAISIEFDRIRDALMQEQTVWEQYQYYYWWRKYHSARMVCTRLAPELKEEFYDRMCHEFRRAMKLGQLRRSDFEKAEWHDICKMADQSLGYHGFFGMMRKVLPQFPGFLRREIAWQIRRADKNNIN